jgi:hypothetical protein
VNVQTVCPGDPDRFSVIGDGRRGKKIGDREHAGLTLIPFTRANALSPDRERPELFKGVQWCDGEPVTDVHASQFRMSVRSSAQFLQDYLSCPAVLIDQKSTQNVEAIGSAKMNQGHGVEH